MIVYIQYFNIASMCYQPYTFEGAFSNTLTVVFLINFWDEPRILAITSQRDFVTDFVMYFSSILDSCIIKYDNMQI